MRKKHIRRYCFIRYNVHRYLKNNLHQSAEKSGLKRQFHRDTKKRPKI